MRNEFRDDGSPNGSCNVVKIGSSRNQQLKAQGKTEADITAILWKEVDQLAARFGAKPALLVALMQPDKGSYGAWMIDASAIRHGRSVPTMPADRVRYRMLADVGTKDARVTADLLNR
jgi:hypothetical protein